MDSGASSGSVIGRSKKQDKTCRSWNAREEEVLIQALKEVIMKGWKSENGFKAVYLTLLENAMHTAIPGTTLRGNLHINSKVHVWKKTYSTLVTLLTKSGVGWNDVENTIDCTDETWEAIVKSQLYNPCDTSSGPITKIDVKFLDMMVQLVNDHITSKMPCTTCDPFNIDTRTSKFGEDMDDSISETHTPSSTPNAASTLNIKKKKQVIDVDQSIVVAINNLAGITKDNMTDLVKQLSAEDKISDAQDKVLEALLAITDLSEDEQVRVAKFLFNNYNDLALFQ